MKVKIDLDLKNEGIFLPILQLLSIATINLGQA